MGDLIHLRIEKQLKDEINKVVDSGMFSNMTEFIRDAIRKSVEKYELERNIRGLERLRGKGRLLTKEQSEKAKAEAKKLTPSELFRKYGLD